MNHGLIVQRNLGKFRLSSALILLVLVLSGCASYEDLRLYARPPDIPLGGSSTINMQSLLAPVWPPMGPATAVTGVGFALTFTSGGNCGTLAATTATSNAGGQANVGFTGAATLTADCTATIQVVATGTPAAPFSETESVSVTVHLPKTIGAARPIGVVAHQPQVGDQFCVFTITAAPAGYTPPSSATLGPLPVNTTFCVECPTTGPQGQQPYGFTFANPATVTLADGSIYYYVTKTGTTCITCPVGGRTYRLENPSC